MDCDCHLRKIRPIPLYTYLCGGVTYGPNGLYTISSIPQLQSIGYGPSYRVSYAVPFAGADYSSIEMMVWEGPYPTGRKLAYANYFSIGNQEGTSLSVSGFGCFGSPGPWNYTCSDLDVT